MSARKTAACAVAVALLIAVQYAFSFVAGVELVTVLLLCFCYVYGIRCGLLTATAFSLVRCLLFGFVPQVVVLYLIYYNLFALLFGFLGKHRPPVWLCPGMLLVLALACGYFALTGIPVSVLYQGRVSAMLWALFGITAALLIFYGVLLIVKRGREIADVTALAAFCTVCFSLLDDVITPLFLGYSQGAAAAYFYTSFLAMLPQTICAAVSVFLLFAPLKKVLLLARGSK